MFMRTGVIIVAALFLTGATAKRMTTIDSTSAARVGRHVENATTTSASGLSVGDLLWDRFHLQALLKPLVAFPYSLKGRFGQPDSATELLGKGSFAETWRVHDKNAKEGDPTFGKDLAIKLFYTQKKSGRGFEHLTQTVIKATPALAAKVAKDIAECKVAQSITSQTQKMRSGSKDLFMECYDTGDSPAFVLLSYGGPTDLKKYLAEKKLETKSIARIFAQIIKGIGQLAKCSPPFMHHDLKSENVVLNEAEEVTLIDFGNIMTYTQGSTEFKPTSMEICPAEFRFGGRFTEGSKYAGPNQAFQWCGKGVCPEAFDTFGAGSMLFEMLVGITQVSMFSQEEGSTAADWYREVDDLFKKPDWPNVLRGWVGSEANNANLERLLKDPKGLAFVKKYLPGMLNNDPSKRPKVAVMLKDPWLSAANTAGKSAPVAKKPANSGKTGGSGGTGATGGSIKDRMKLWGN